MSKSLGLPSFMPSSQPSSNPSIASYVFILKASIPSKSSTVSISTPQTASLAASPHLILLSQACPHHNHLQPSSNPSTRPSLMVLPSSIPSSLSQAQIPAEHQLEQISRNNNFAPSDVMQVA
mmetsp:Transcript_13365/g.29035  ORF Transcript_13365/g.29035 Transcript_13365/m.29035 type:complete len:122 (+) Transcript_13365:537-902(+)